jgi:flagellum-specific ATP synthase
MTQTSTVPQIDFHQLRQVVRQAPDWRHVGLVKRVIGLTIEATGPHVSIGDTCFVEVGSSAQVATEVVGFRDDRILMMPLGELTGIAPGAKVTSPAKPLSVPVGPELVGRVLNSLGEPIDGKGPLKCQAMRSVQGRPPTPLDRPMIDTPLSVGVRAIDSLITCGKGQRIAIMAGSGVGKSSLLGMMARYTAAEINCIALIGERGREVREFIERDLGPEGLARSIVIVATSDEPALLRIRGAMVATTLAEYFRDQGRDVLLMMDSLTRFAMAQREIGLAIGEPPTTRGYTPSVFSLLPKLLERAGAGERGTITGFYTVLVDGDDFTEPIADAVRSIVDGHIVLSRVLGEHNHYPAIDVLASLSRVMNGIVDDKHKRAAGLLRDTLATFRDAEDLVNVGAYKPGTNARIDTALGLIDAVNAFLRQARDEGSTFEEGYEGLLNLFPVD